MQSFKNKSLIQSLLAFCFILTTMCISSVYAAPVITIETHEVGQKSFSFGQIIDPSQQNPLLFEFKSDDSLTYTCKILKIDEKLFGDLLDANEIGSISNINLVGVGTEISNQNCGTGVTQSDVTYTQVFPNGFFVFQVIGTDSDGVGTKTPWAFQVEAGQAAPEEGGPSAGVTATNANQFWTHCSDITGPNPSATLQKIKYTMEGRSKIDKLKFNSNLLDLIVKTNTQNNAISAEFSSKSTEDFKIETLDTECMYNLPEVAGQQMQPGATKSFNTATVSQWNPPVPSCAGDRFMREITYHFKVTSNLDDLKDTKKRHVDIDFVVDVLPNESGEVRGELTLDDKKEINIEVDGEPKVQCSGETVAVS